MIDQRAVITTMIEAGQGRPVISPGPLLAYALCMTVLWVAVFGALWALS